MKVIEVLQSNKQTLASCTPEEPILTIAERLSALNIGALPVCGAGAPGSSASSPNATSCAASPATEQGSLNVTSET